MSMIAAPVFSLMQATTSGDSKAVIELLRRGADPNSMDETGATCLFKAVQVQHRVIVEELIRWGADVNMAKEDGRSPLHEVADKGLTDIAAILISFGANVDRRSGAHEGRTPLHSAACRGHSAIAVKLLLRGADVDCVSLKECWTALHFATSFGHCDTMLLLIEYGADVNAADFLGITPLYCAELSQRDNPVNQEAVEILQRHGAKNSTGSFAHLRAPELLLPYRSNRKCAKGGKVVDY
jgi:ankyrin repeat protein